LLCEFAELGSFEETIENLRQVLQVPKICESPDVESQGFGVGFVEPKSGSVEPFFIRLSGASHTPQIEDKFQGGQGIVDPRQLEPSDQILRRGIGHHVEEEVQAGVSGGQKRRGEVFRETHRRSSGVLFVGIVAGWWFACVDLGGYGGGWAYKTSSRCHLF